MCPDSYARAICGAIHSPAVCPFGNAKISREQRRSEPLTERGPHREQPEWDASSTNIKRMSFVSPGYCALQTLHIRPPFYGGLGNSHRSTIAEL